MMASQDDCSLSSIRRMRKQTRLIILIFSLILTNKVEAKSSLSVSIVHLKISGLDMHAIAFQREQSTDLQCVPINMGIQ